MRRIPPRLVTLLSLILLNTLAPSTIPTSPAASSPVHAAARVPREPDTTGLGDLPLRWATYLGGKGNDAGHGVTADGQGNVYVTGSAGTGGFPVTTDAAQSRDGGSIDGFVASYAATGKLRWATYLGGTAVDDGTAIAADRKGDVYVTGVTDSPNFPVTTGVAQPYDGGGYDAFIAAYSANGQLRWATYLGGTGDDQGHGISIDGHGNVYVIGTAGSADFPVTFGAVQSRNGGAHDAFLASYTANGKLRWATYLGGKGDEEGNGVAVDGQGNPYVTGNTDSADFPVTLGAVQPHGSGGGDAFVAAYTANGKLRWATYLGGKGDDEGNGVAVDSQGNLYLTGNTDSADFPVTIGAVQPHGSGGGDAFVAAYTPSGRPRWATYLGGKGDDEGNGVAVDSQGNLYLTGNTDSADFPGTLYAAPHHGSGDDATFVAAYTANGRLHWTSYLGGMVDDEGHCITVDGRGNIYVTDDALGPSFPVTPGAAQTIYGGNGDVFLDRLVIPTRKPPALDPASSLPSGTAHARFFSMTHHTLAGPFLTFWNRLGGISTLGLPLSEPFTLAGRRIQVTERAVLVLVNGKIQLLALGSLLSASSSFAQIAPESSTATRLYFPSTGHSLAAPFLTYWQAHQGSELLGAPLGEPQREGLGDGSGQSYLVQWFVNGRLEDHPEIKGQPNQIELGRVGYEFLQRQGLL